MTDFRVGQEVEVHGWSAAWNGPAKVVNGPWSPPCSDTVLYTVKRGEPGDRYRVGAFETVCLRELTSG